MIENGEIPLDKLIFRSNIFYPSSSSSPINQYDQKLLTDTQNSLLNMKQIKIKLRELRLQTLTLKAICRIKIKNVVRTYPNDIVQIKTISKFLQAYLTFYNPFIKADVTETI
jgi:hypothetical protein